MPGSEFIQTRGYGFLGINCSMQAQLAASIQRHRATSCSSCAVDHMIHSHVIFTWPPHSKVSALASHMCRSLAPFSFHTHKPIALQHQQKQPWRPTRCSDYRAPPKHLASSIAEGHPAFTTSQQTVPSNYRSIPSLTENALLPSRSAKASSPPPGQRSINENKCDDYERTGHRIPVRTVMQDQYQFASEGHPS